MTTYQFDCMYLLGTSIDQLPGFDRFTGNLGCIAEFAYARRVTWFCSSEPQCVCHVVSHVTLLFFPGELSLWRASVLLEIRVRMPMSTGAFLPSVVKHITPPCAQCVSYPKSRGTPIGTSEFSLFDLLAALPLHE